MTLLWPCTDLEPHDFFCNGGPSCLKYIDDDITLDLLAQASDSQPSLAQQQPTHHTAEASSETANPPTA